MQRVPNYLEALRGIVPHAYLIEAVKGVRCRYGGRHAEWLDRGRAAGATVLDRQTKPGAEL